MSQLTDLLRTLRFRTALTLTIVALGLMPLAVSGYLNWRAGSEALLGLAFDQLESVRELKKSQIEQFVRTTINESEALASGPFVVEGVMGLVDAYQQLTSTDTLPDGLTLDELAKRNAATAERDFTGAYTSRDAGVAAVAADQTSPNGTVLRYLYTTANANAYASKSELAHAGDRSLYSRLHRRYHTHLKRLIAQFDIEDMLIVDSQRGEVVYSVRKRLDFGTNLIDGPYANSITGQAFRAARDSNATVLTQLQRYRPALDGPSAYVGVPVIRGGEQVGVMLLTLPITGLAGILAEVSGMGQSGDSVLLGPNKEVLVRGRWSDLSQSLAATLDNAAVERVLSDESGVMLVEHEKAGQQLTAFAPLKVPGVDWALMVTVDENEIRAGLAPLVRTALIALLLAAAILFASSYALANKIVAPINRAAVYAKRIASGVLDTDIPVRDGNEIDDMLTALGQMQTQLRERIARDASVVASMSRQTQALEQTSSGIIATDGAGEIVFANASARATLAANGVPEAAIQGANVESLLQPLIGGPLVAGEWIIGSTTLAANLNDVHDESGARIGRVVEWQDRTEQRRVGRDIGTLIEQARRGDLSQRLSVDSKDAEGAVLAQGVNSLIAISQTVVNDMAAVLSALAKGDLSAGVDTAYEGAFDDLKRDANQTVARLTEIVAQIRHGATSVNTSAAALASSSAELDRMMSVQMNHVGEARSRLANLQTLVDNNANAAGAAAERSAAVSTDAGAGRDVVGSAVAAMSEIHAASARIEDIIRVIDEIAFQTNLLALNASVEAARAGEHGLGFAVVAREVRELAGRSATAAQSINQLIADTVAKVNDGSRLVNQTGEIFGQIAEGIEQVSATVAEISTSSGEQAGGVGAVAQALEQIDTIARDNTGRVQDSAATAAHLNADASSLAGAVAFFEDGPQKSTARDYRGAA